MSNKVSIKDIKAIVKANKQDTIKFTFGSVPNAIEIEFKPRLSLAEESVFVNRVCNNSFDINDDYQPEYQNIMFDITMMQMLSNLPIPKEKNDKGVEMIDFEEFKAWDNELHFKNTILKAGLPSSDSPENINDFSDYIVFLEDMVNDKINYLKEQNLHKSKVDEFFSTLTDVVNKQSANLDGVDINAVLKKIASMKLNDKTIIDEILKQSKKDEDAKNKVVNIKKAKK